MGLATLQVKDWENIRDRHWDQDQERDFHHSPLYLEVQA